MTLEIQGIIEWIGPVVKVTDTFRKREFAVEVFTTLNGITYSDFAKMQVVNNSVDLLEDRTDVDTIAFVVGDGVKCQFTLKGNKDKKKDDVYYNNLQVTSIVSIHQNYTPHDYGIR